MVEQENRALLVGGQLNGQARLAEARTEARLRELDLGSKIDSERASDAIDMGSSGAKLCFGAQIRAAESERAREWPCRNNKTRRAIADMASFV